MNVLISCIGRRGYIPFYLRKHLDRNDQIIGTSNSEWTSGFHYCDKGIILPDTGSKDHIPALLRLCKEQRIDILFSLFDLDVSKLSKHLDEFIKIGVLPIIPKPGIVEICFDKYQTHIFLEKNGLKSAKTFLQLEDALVDISKKKINFPLVVKPKQGFSSKNIFIARNIDELKVFFSYSPGMIIQERIQGQEYHFDILNDLEGRVVSVVPKRKIAMRSGETDQALTVKDQTLLEYGVKLGNTLKHIGNLDVDFFVYKNDITVLEMNPRFGGGYPLSHMAGIDFFNLILKMARGEKVEPIVGKYEEGIYMMKENAFICGSEKDLFKNIEGYR